MEMLTEKEREEAQGLMVGALKDAINLYLKFTAQSVSIALTERDFQDYQKGCKAALNHIDSLLKLLRHMEFSGGTDGNYSRLEEIIAIAEKNVKEHDNVAKLDH